MTLSIEQVMSDAKKLVDRLTEHDSNTDTLIAQTETLNKRIDAMKQYQEDLAEMNEAARHRPRSALVLGIQQENRQIRELQQENKELRTALEEHQSALELIMTKYREQVLKLILANKVDSNSLDATQNNSKELQVMTQKICEMAMVMSEAVNIDDEAVAKETELITRLQVENKGLREILGISRHFRKPWPKKYPRDDSYGQPEPFHQETTEEHASDHDTSVVSVKETDQKNDDSDDKNVVPQTETNEDGNRSTDSNSNNSELIKGGLETASECHETVGEKVEPVGTTSDDSRESESKDARADSGDVETVTEDSDTHSGDVETVNEDSGTQSGDVETVNEDIETQSGDVETVNEDSETQSGDVETVNEDIETQSGDIETVEETHCQSGDVEIVSKETHTDERGDVETVKEEINTNKSGGEETDNKEEIPCDLDNTVTVVTKSSDEDENIKEVDDKDIQVEMRGEDKGEGVEEKEGKDENSEGTKITNTSDSEKEST